MSVRFALALAIVLAVPAGSAAQAQIRDTMVTNAPVRDLPLTAEQRRPFVGSYTVTLPHGEQSSFAVFEESGVLKGRPGEEGAAKRLLYQGENVFVAEGMSDFVLTFVVVAGRAARFTVRRADGVITGVRAS